MELMKLNAAIGIVLRCCCSCCCCSFSSSSSSSAKCDVRSLRDVRVDSGLSGIDYKHTNTHAHTPKNAWRSMVWAKWWDISGYNECTHTHPLVCVPNWGLKFNDSENRGHYPTGVSPRLVSVYSNKCPRW